MIYTSDFAEQKKKHAGEPYRPSNGTEGGFFQCAYCEKCKHDNFNPDTGEGGCQILVKTFAYDITDDEYPREWIISSEGQPVCTAFELEHANA